MSTPLREMEAAPEVGQLVISRHADEWFVVETDPPVLVQIAQCSESKARLRILTDRKITILRGELYERDNAS